MWKLFRKRILPLLIAVGLILLSLYLYKRYRIAPDIDFPQVEVVYLNEDEASLQQLSEDKLTLVVFWATWCSVCREEIPYLKELNSIYSEEDLEIVMISDEPVSTIAAFVEAEELDFTFLKLNSKSADLEVHKIPTAYLIKEGKELDNEVGLYDWTSEEGRQRIDKHLSH